MTPQPDASQTLGTKIMAFRVTQLIYVAARLRIADLLHDGPRTAEELAQATHAHGPSLYRVLRALAAEGIFAEDEQGRFSMTPLAEPLRTGVPGSQRSTALVFGEPVRWSVWGNLLYTVTTGEPAFQHLYGTTMWEYQAQHPDMNQNFNDFQAAGTSRQTAAVVAAYDFSPINTLVDVGGGNGTLIAAILQAKPNLRGILCDAPHVVSAARPVLEAAGVADRCEIEACDFFSSVPAGGDAYILKYIIHDWDDEHALAILRTVRKAVADGGRLLLVENVIPPGNDPHPAKMTDLQMMIALGGRERSAAEFASLLEQTGFRATNVIQTQSTLSIIEAVAQ